MLRDSADHAPALGTLPPFPPHRHRDMFTLSRVANGVVTIHGEVKHRWVALRCGHVRIKPPTAATAIGLPNAFFMRVHPNGVVYYV